MGPTVFVGQIDITLKNVSLVIDALQLMEKQILSIYSCDTAQNSIVL